MASTAITRTLPNTTQLKKQVRFILEPVYRFGCSRQVTFPSHAAVAVTHVLSTAANLGKVPRKASPRGLTAAISNEHVRTEIEG
jgi:hypothetical protein